MSIRQLRTEKGWSQDQLAQLSGLSLRTIQRAECGEAVGLESQKSLAAVFEMTLDELRASAPERTLASEDCEQLEDALRQVRARKRFFMTAVVGALLLGAMMTFLPERAASGTALGGGLLLVLFVGLHANRVFHPLGLDWERREAKKLMTRRQS